ncbi:MAG: YheC/YheD family protein [Firmicutes bacterium]|nr:YheC/YheD family protein [Bacillota bacterium]
MLVNITTKANEKATVYLSKFLLDHFLINNGQLFTLKVGMLEMPVWIRVLDVLEDSSIKLTSDVISYFNLITAKKFYINVHNSKLEIRLGPFLGVFVNTRFFNSLCNGEIIESAEHMFNAVNHDGGLVYYFSCANIHWLDRKIKGVTFNKEGKIKYSWFGFPKVIYDRGVGFDKDEKQAVKFFRNQISKNKDVCFINSVDYLDKWKTYKYLNKNPFIGDMLPETKLYSDISDISEMLKKYCAVYLKARYGSRGQKILIIYPEPDKRFKIKTSNNEYIVSSMLDLRSFMIEFFENQPFVVQQPIELYQYDGKKSDMRVLLCKDGKGNWQVIYNQVKIADKHKPITNVSMGGEVEDFISYYTVVFGNENKAKELNDYISEAAVKVSYALEGEVGPMGEVGLDMGLDKNMKLWFIEANTKPDKNPEAFEEIAQGGIFTQFLNIVKYANLLERCSGSGNNV